MSTNQLPLTLLLLALLGCEGESIEYDGGPRLDVGRGYLGDFCSTDFDCNSNLVCRVGFCNMQGRQGEECAGVGITECRAGLECVSGACTATGGEGEPCTLGVVCDDGLVCGDGVCSPTVRARFCHCLVSSTFGDPLFIRMEVAGMDLGEARTGECTGCREVPSGAEVPVTMFYDDGRELGTAMLNIMPALEEQVLYGLSNGVEAYDVACGEPVGVGCIP